MNYEERVVGYDAREMWLDPGAQWPEKRREDFLFRPDVSKPFSTDTAVWPSVFGLQGGDAPADRFGFQDTWEDLEKVEAHVREAHDAPLRPCHVIAITLLAEPSDGRGGVEWNTLLPRPTPDARRDSWSFLGYDVSDTWLLSGLLDCGFTPETEDVPSLRDRWGPLLNQHHLFDKLEHAASFSTFSDARAAEHAPFWVFGIWLIKSYGRA